jgi:hypothetical protein
MTAIDLQFTHNFLLSLCPPPPQRARDAAGIGGLLSKEENPNRSPLFTSLFHGGFVMNLSSDARFLAFSQHPSPKIFHCLLATSLPHCSLGWERNREGIDSADLVLDRGDLVQDHGDTVLDHGDLVLDHGDLVLDRGDLCLVSCGTNKGENRQNRAESRLTRAEAWSSVRFHHNYHLIPKGKNPSALLRTVHVVDVDIIPTFICEI